jgi:hypothetical protein
VAESWSALVQYPAGNNCNARSGPRARYLSASGQQRVLPVQRMRKACMVSTCMRRALQLASAKDDMLFTRLHVSDPHWKGSRKTLARAFSADEIRYGNVAASINCGDTECQHLSRFNLSQRHNLCAMYLSRSMLLGSAPVELWPLADCTAGTVGSGLPALAYHPIPWPCCRPSAPGERRRKKFGATVDATLALAAQLAALPPGAAVEAQDAMKRVTLVRAQPAKRMSF